MTNVDIEVHVNGSPRRHSVPPRLTLADYLRVDCGLTGTHLGCEHGVCGACTVLLDGEAVRACLVFAVQADGAEVTTIEAMASDDGTLSPIQAAFRDHHGLQCGFCTPGFIVIGDGVPGGKPVADRRRDPGSTVREHLPMHRISGHHHGSEGCRGHHNEHRGVT